MTTPAGRCRSAALIYPHGEIELLENRIELPPSSDFKASGETCYREFWMNNSSNMAIAIQHIQCAIVVEQAIRAIWI